VAVAIFELLLKNNLYNTKFRIFMYLEAIDPPYLRLLYHYPKYAIVIGPTRVM